MEITAILAQKKGSRRNLEIDGKFFCGIDESLIIELKLYSGKKVDQKLLSKIKNEDEYQKGLKKAYALLAIRLNSEKELKDKLRRKFSDNVTARVISRLKELRYIDDKAFIVQWISEREGTRGSYLLKRELTQKGINKDFILEYFEGRDEEKDYLNALKLAEKKSWKILDEEEKSKKIGALLARHGFDYGTIKKVLSRK